MVARSVWWSCCYGYRFYFILFYLGFVWVLGVNHVMFDGWNSLGLRKLLGHTMLDDVSVFFFFFNF